MNNIFLIINKKRKAKVIKLFFPLILNIIAVFFVIIFTDANSTSYLDLEWFIAVVFAILFKEIQLLVVIWFSYKYIMKKGIFINSYFIFFISYFFFFFFFLTFTITTPHKTMSEIFLRYLYFSFVKKEDFLILIDIFSYLFLVVFIVHIFIMKKKIIRYIFSFLTVFSHIILNLYVLMGNNKNIFEDIIFMIVNVNEQFYIQKLYLIPLSFALIQFIIEVYYFYKKEEKKYQRYKRLQSYKGRISLT